MLNTTLANIILSYSLKSHAEFQQDLQGLSKDTVISSLTDLLTQYANDKNSSSIREFLTVCMAGFSPNPEKIGYNGYRHDASAGAAAYCEAKPQNIPYTEDKAKRVLNGGGNFTDYTWTRFERSLKENPLMLISGFIGGRMAYLMSFPFADAVFAARLEGMLRKHYEKIEGAAGVYLRSASFRYQDYMDSPDLKFIHADLAFLRENVHLVNKRFLKALDAKLGGESVKWQP